MNTFKRKVLRRWIIRCAASVIVLAAIIGCAYGVGNLALQLPQPLQATFLYIAGAIGIVVTYGTGILIERIAVRSWDTWIGDLGPAEIDVLGEAMQQHKKQLKSEE